MHGKRRIANAGFPSQYIPALGSTVEVGWELTRRNAVSPCRFLVLLCHRRQQPLTGLGET